MLQGAWVSLTVGFVAVGIAVLIGIFLGGIAGYFGQNHICLNHILIALLLFTGGILLFMGNMYLGLICLITGIVHSLPPFAEKDISEKSSANMAADTSQKDDLY